MQIAYSLILQRFLSILFPKYLKMHTASNNFASRELLFPPFFPVAPDVAPEVVTELPERVEEEEPAPPSRTEPAKQKVTEEDLEDWLDSMIS